MIWPVSGLRTAASVNRELAALKRAFKIAVDSERLSRAPKIDIAR
jgi:hypothetical protein